MIIPKDERDPFWPILEKEIQGKALKKDPGFVLTGPWKQFVRDEAGHAIYAIDGTWIRNNLCAYFGHGGHGYVHEFIPDGEIWVSTHHYDEGEDDISKCNCTVREKNRLVSQNYFDSTALHERTECEAMKTGRPYWEAHNLALEAERQAGFLKEDPWTDIGYPPLGVSGMRSENPTGS